VASVTITKALIDRSTSDAASMRAVIPELACMKFTSAPAPTRTFNKST